MTADSRTLKSAAAPVKAASRRWRNRRILLVTGGIALLAGAGAWAYFGRVPAADAPPVQIVKFAASEKFAEMSPEAQKPYRDALENLDRGDRRDVVEQAKLTDDERERLFTNTGGKEMEQRIDAYFALATPAEKSKYIDSMIDEMQKRFASFQRRSTTRPTGEANGSGDRPNQGGPGGRGWGDPERMKRRMENTPPARQAKMAEFHVAMQKRMKERGMKPPWEK